MAFAVLAASFAACSPASSAERPGLLERLREAHAGNTGRLTTQALQAGGLDREYLLLDGRRGQGPAPLVIVLHGGGGSPGRSCRAGRRRRGRRARDCRAEGHWRNGRSGTWNAGGCCGEALARGVDDVGFIAAVIDDVAKRTAIDPRRIYVTGFSNGGMLTHRVAARAGQRIAAAAVVSGALSAMKQHPAPPVPMLIMHGEQDPVVGFDGGVSSTRFCRPGAGAAVPAGPLRRRFLAQGQWLHPTRRHHAKSGSLDREKRLQGQCRRRFLYDLKQGGHSWRAQISLTTQGVPIPSTPPA